MICVPVAVFEEELARVLAAQRAALVHEDPDDVVDELHPLRRAT